MVAPDRHPQDAAGSRQNLDRVLPELYEELRRLASRELSHERVGHTLQTTALAHEAYLRLARQHQADWLERGKLLSAAASFMRRILVDHARRRMTSKRGGDRLRLSLMDGLDQDGGEPEVDFLALDEALDRLAELNQRQARAVELRYFGGLTIEETASELETSVATVNRDWRLAKAWLYRELSQAG